MAAVEKHENKHDVYIFRVGSAVAAVPAGSVERVFREVTVVPSRTSPGGILGLFERDEQRGAVVDLHWKFGFSVSSRVEAYTYLVVRLGARTGALRVDEVEPLASLPADAFEMLLVPGSGEGLGYLRGVIRYEGREIPLIDPELLVSDAALREVLRAA